MNIIISPVFNMANYYFHYKITSKSTIVLDFSANWYKFNISIQKRKYQNNQIPGGVQ